MRPEMRTVGKRGSGGRGSSTEHVVMNCPLVRTGVKSRKARNVGDGPKGELVLHQGIRRKSLWTGDLTWRPQEPGLVLREGCSRQCQSLGLRPEGPLQ